MANVFDKVNQIYLESVHTPDYEGDQFIVNPELPEGFSSFDEVIWDNGFVAKPAPTVSTTNDPTKEELLLEIESLRQRLEQLQ